MDSTDKKVSYIANSETETFTGSKLNAAAVIRRKPGPIKDTHMGDDDPYSKKFADEAGREYLVYQFGAGALGNGIYPKELIPLDYADSDRNKNVDITGQVVLDVFGLHHDIKYKDIITYVSDALQRALIASLGPKVDIYPPVPQNIEDPPAPDNVRRFVTVDLTGSQFTASILSYMQNKPFLVVYRDFDRKIAHTALKHLTPSILNEDNTITVKSGSSPLSILVKKGADLETDNNNVGIANVISQKPGALYGSSPLVNPTDFLSLSALANAQSSVSGAANLTIYSIDSDLAKLLYHLALSVVCIDAATYFDGNASCIKNVENPFAEYPRKIEIGGNNQSYARDPVTAPVATVTGPVPVPVPDTTSPFTSTSASLSATSTDPQNVLWSRYLETVAARRAASRARSSRSKKARPRSRSGRFRRSRSRSRSRTRRGKSPARRRKSRSRSRSRR